MNDDFLRQIGTEITIEVGTDLSSAARELLRQYEKNLIDAPTGHPVRPAWGLFNGTLIETHTGLDTEKTILERWDQRRAAYQSTPEGLRERANALIAEADSLVRFNRTLNNVLLAATRLRFTKEFADQSLILNWLCRAQSCIDDNRQDRAEIDPDIQRIAGRFKEQVLGRTEDMTVREFCEAVLAHGGIVQHMNTNENFRPDDHTNVFEYICGNTVGFWHPMVWEAVDQWHKKFAPEQGVAE